MCIVSSIPRTLGRKQQCKQNLALWANLKKLHLWTRKSELKNVRFVQQYHVFSLRADYAGDMSLPCDEIIKKLILVFLFFCINSMISKELDHSAVCRFAIPRACCCRKTKKAKKARSECEQLFFFKLWTQNKILNKKYQLLYYILEYASLGIRNSAKIVYCVWNRT